jgi:hypothetical protein
VLRLPPIGLAATEPVSSCCSDQRITLEARTLNSFAADSISVVYALAATTDTVRPTKIWLNRMYCVALFSPSSVEVIRKMKASS